MLSGKHSVYTNDKIFLMICKFYIALENIAFYE
jgi:hypothetical protein